MDHTFSEKRTLAEMERSRQEAEKIHALVPAQVERYLDPPANTPYPLEYAFHLLGNIRGQTVLDLGCGTGENMVPLLARGAYVTGIDISPELIALAKQRLADNDQEFYCLRTGDACHTGLEAESVDLVFSAAVVHHLDIGLANQEIWRVLRPGGVVILKEPVQTGAYLARGLRALLPAHADISEYEHPLTREELHTLTEGFEIEQTRLFRLRFVALAPHRPAAWKASAWILEKMPELGRYATTLVARLRKQ